MQHPLNVYSGKKVPKQKGLYIHIPFCERLCIYCDFAVTTARKYVTGFTDSVISEITLYKNALGRLCFDTVYFGGGTPSFLPDHLLEKIVLTIKSDLDISPGAEWTIEVNPNHISPQKLRFYKNAGFNRLSIGAQSFLDKELKFLTRLHSAGQSESAFRDARAEGFNNINIDLIYGLPGQEAKDWQYNLDKLLSFGPEHVSLYALGVEEGTPLKRFVDKGKIAVPDDNQYLDFYLTAVKRLTAAGYEHYEISNFAKPGYRAVHNSHYWNRSPYLGLGPSAHSFDGTKRWWNHLSVDRYIAACLQERKRPLESEERLTQQDILNEMILLGFRIKEGVSVAEMEHLTGKPFYEYYSKAIASCREFLIIGADAVSLNTRGWFLYNAICREFMSL